VSRLRLIAFLGCLVVACSSAPGAVGRGVDTFVAASGVTLHVHTVGASSAAETLIAVHGGPGLDAVSMGPYDTLAGANRRVITYDQRGAGRSTSPADADYRIAAQVADLEAVRVAANAPTVELVGESWGGAVAAAYTAAHPDRVHALVLVGAVPLDRAELRAGEQRFLAYISHLQGQHLIVTPLPSAARGSCLPTVRASLPAYAADPRHVPEVSLGTCTAATSRATYDAFLSDAGVDGLASQLASYRGRALVVMGDHDAFGVQWLHRNIGLLSGARVDQLLVVNAGHIVAAEQPSTLFGRIATFLAA